MKDSVSSDTSYFQMLSVLSGYIQDVLFWWWRQTRAGGWGQRSLTVARTHHPRAHQVRDGEKERFTAAEFFTGRREGPAGTSHYLKVMRFHTWRTQWHVKVCPPDLLDPIWWSRGVTSSQDIIEATETEIVLHPFYTDYFNYNFYCMKVFYRSILV